MLNRRGASTHPRRRSCSTVFHPEHTPSPSRTHVLLLSWNLLMTEIIFCSTPKRASTVHRRVRSTRLYALIRSIKHTSYNGTTTNIISVVERFGQKPHLSKRALPARYLCSCRTLSGPFFVEYHDEGIFPLLLLRYPPPPQVQIQTAVWSSLPRSAESLLRMILDSLTGIPSDPTVFPFAIKRMASVSRGLNS